MDGPLRKSQARNTVQALATDTPGETEVMSALARITASAPFRSAPKVTAFLRFIVERTLAGDAARIKGYTIATEALGRKPDFDPQLDPIVRVEAGRLRQALARYYLGEGAAERVIIELPRGSYVPRFHRRPDLRAPDWTQRGFDPATLPGGGLLPWQAALPQLIELFLAIGAVAKWPGATHEEDPRDATAFEVVSMLDALIARLTSASDLKHAVDIVLDAAITLHQSDFGNVQLLDRRTRELTIYAQRGFREPFLRFFASVSADDSCACGIALRQGRQIVVEDVQLDPDFAPYRAVAAQAGYRAVQSTPLISSTGSIVGVLSTHFARPRRPSRLAMLTTRLYARFAADLLARLAPAAAP